MNANWSDDVFLEAVGAVVRDALRSIGPSPTLRFALFRRLLAAAQEVLREASGDTHKDA
jgi:hypothetical protein